MTKTLRKSGCESEFGERFFTWIFCVVEVVSIEQEIFLLDFPFVEVVPTEQGEEQTDGRRITKDVVESRRV